jgi:hypothetical protein
MKTIYAKVQLPYILAHTPTPELSLKKFKFRATFAR